MADDKKALNELENIEDVYLMNMSINARFIRAIWSLSGRDKDELYDVICKRSSSFQDIISCKGDYSEKRYNNWAVKVNYNTGINKDYLTGKQLISVSEDYEAKINKAFEEYWEKMDDIGDYISSRQVKKVYISENKLKKMIEKLNDKEKKEFNHWINKAKPLIKKCEKIESIVKKEAKRIYNTPLDEAYRMYDIEIYKLLFFIKVGSKYDCEIINKIDKVKKDLEDIHTTELRILTKSEIAEFIELLENKVELAKAVYTIRNDLKNFNEK